MLLASINFRSVEMLGGLDECLRMFGGIENCAITLDRKLIGALEGLEVNSVDLRRVGAWVINSRTDIEKALRRRVRQITTDVPTLAIEVFRQMNLQE